MSPLNLFSDDKCSQHHYFVEALTISGSHYPLEQLGESWFIQTSSNVLKLIWEENTHFLFVKSIDHSDDINRRNPIRKVLLMKENLPKSSFWIREAVYKKENCLPVFFRIKKGAHRAHDHDLLNVHTRVYHFIIKQDLITQIATEKSFTWCIWVVLFLRTLNLVGRPVACWRSLIREWTMVQCLNSPWTLWVGKIADRWKGDRWNVSGVPLPMQHLETCRLNPRHPLKKNRTQCWFFKRSQNLLSHRGTNKSQKEPDPANMADELQFSSHSGSETVVISWLCEVVRCPHEPSTFEEFHLHAHLTIQMTESSLCSHNSPCLICIHFQRPSPVRTQSDQTQSWASFFWLDCVTFMIWNFSVRWKPYEFMIGNGVEPLLIQNNNVVPSSGLLGAQHRQVGLEQWTRVAFWSSDKWCGTQRRSPQWTRVSQILACKPWCLGDVWRGRAVELKRMGILQGIAG
jgi:hypothetical protein